MKKKRALISTAITIVIVLLVLTGAYFLSNTEKKSLNNSVRAGLPGQFIELPLGYVHYELGGPAGAPTVVLVHGFSVPYYIWDPTFDALTQAGLRVLRYDLYGRGYSDRPDQEYNLELFVTQLHQLLNALNIQQPVDLVGLSMGGPIAAKYTNDYPEGVRSLTLIDPESAPVSVKQIFPLNLPLIGEYLMDVYIAPVMLPKTQAEDFFDPGRFPGWEGLYRDQLQYKGFRRAILSTIRAQPGMDSMAEFEAVGKLDLPVLMLWGKEDKTISYADIQLVRKAIPGIEFHSIERAGHIPQYEQPEIVNPILIEFLKGSRNTATP